MPHLLTLPQGSAAGQAAQQPDNETGPVRVDATRRLSVTEVCQQFEAAFKAGQKPRIEDYLGQRPEPHRSVLLCHLLVLELAYRLDRHESPSAEEYRLRFPEHLSVIEGVLPKGSQTAPQPAPVAGAVEIPAKAASLSRHQPARETQIQAPRQVRHQEPRPLEKPPAVSQAPRQARPLVPAVGKPQSNGSSTSILQAEEPIVAWPASAFEELSELATRQPWVSILLMVGVLAVATTSCALTLFHVRGASEHQRATFHEAARLVDSYRARGMAGEALRQRIRDEANASADVKREALALVEASQNRAP